MSARRCIVRATLAVVALLCLLLALRVSAQPVGRIPTVGVLFDLPLSSAPATANIEALRKGLHRLGYREGETIRIAIRSSEGRPELVSALADELVRTHPDVVVSAGTPAALALKRATNTIPVVAISGDPVRTGVVASLARPGGNVTGLAVMTEELDRKQLELLKEAVPGASRVAVLGTSANPALALSMKGLQEFAPRLGVRLQVLEVRVPDEIEGAFAAAVRGGAGAALVLREHVFTARPKQIVELAAKHRLPAMYGWRAFADAGGLMVYGFSFPEMFRQAASFVDKILKGAKPSDLPVEQPTKFELIVNMRTAKALGLTIPPSILVRADQIIE